MVDRVFDSNERVNKLDQENTDNNEAENDMVVNFNDIGLEGDNK